MEFVENSWNVVHRVFGPDLYSGTSGIGLFLSHLYSYTPERTFRLTAEGALRQAVSRLEDLAPSRIGFYVGCTGVAYALISMGELLGLNESIDAGFALLSDLANDEQPLSWDVLSGSAGALPVWLKLHRRYSKKFLLGLAVRHGDMLLAAAEQSDVGWSWDTLHLHGQTNLTGFSHGTAGISWALLELYSVTGERRFRTGAEEGFRYERHYFSRELENWPDFRNFSLTRDPSDKPGYLTAWCHGAPGIGLSRLRAYELLRDETCRTEAEAALRTTAHALKTALTSGVGNYSLCHGNAGNAELLLYANQVLGLTEHNAVLAEVADVGVRQHHFGEYPWPCGVTDGGQTPNLMLGLAGIAYFYLRMHDPQRTPSLLIVCPS
jgi:lantibiotic modifying enzyme